MQSLDATTLGTIAAIAAFLYSYVKDRHESGKSIGRLEERVARLEVRDQAIEQMSESITDLKVHIATMQQELRMISEWVRRQQG